MNKFSLLIEQLRQCKIFIKKNDIASLRMALILLDNTAEIAIYRSVKNELEYNDLLLILDEKARSLPKDKYDKFMQESNLPKPIFKTQYRKILRYFDEMALFLSNRNKIDRERALIISSLHKYRNEIYHRDIVREEILGALCIIYFEMICSLFLELDIRPSSYSSNDDWTWFNSKYKLASKCKTMYPFEDNTVKKILGGFRKDLQIDFTKIKTNFIIYTEGRLASMVKELEFVKKCSGLFEDQKLFKFMSEKYINEGENKIDICVVNADNLKCTKNGVEKLFSMNDYVNLFKTFINIEKVLSPNEMVISYFYQEYDKVIQFKIDEARGK